MGVGTRAKTWRFTDINKDYQVKNFLSSYHGTMFDWVYSLAQLTRRVW